MVSKTSAGRAYIHALKGFHVVPRAHHWGTLSGREREKMPRVTTVSPVA